MLTAPLLIVENVRRITLAARCSQCLNRVCRPSHSSRPGPSSSRVPRPAAVARDGNGVRCMPPLAAEGAANAKESGGRVELSLDASLAVESTDRARLGDFGSTPRARHLDWLVKNNAVEPHAFHIRAEGGKRPRWGPDGR